MKIRVKVGDVEIEYSEPQTDVKTYTAITSRDNYSDDKTYNVLMNNIRSLCDKAVEMNRRLYEQ